MKAVKLKNKGFEISLEIYPFIIFVSFINVNNFKTLLKNNKYSKDITEKEIDDILSYFDGEFAAKTLQLNNGNILIYFKYSNYSINNEYMFNTIAHESLHATQMILDRIGMKLNKKTDEAYCYLNGYIVEQIMREI